MGVIEKQKRVWAYRGKIVLLSRPTVAWQDDRVRFWTEAAKGAKTVAA